MGELLATRFFRPPGILNIFRGSKSGGVVSDTIFGYPKNGKGLSVFFRHQKKSSEGRKLEKTLHF